MTTASAPPRVAYFGPQTTNTHAAALEIFGEAAEFSPYSTIPGVFDAVATRAMTHGVVPIENSTEGTIRETVDCLLTKSPVIQLEHEMAIRHCLMGLPGAPPAERAFIVSHPQPLAQCRLWLETHFPNVPRRTSASTAAAAREAASDPTLLAVATELAAKTLDLTIFAREIADRAHNATRFVCISLADGSPTGNDKTSLVLSTPHVRGALRKVLGILDDAEVSLSRIESRPLPDRAWEYAFVIDVDGHRTDANVAAALDILREKGHLVRMLGSYPKCRPSSE
jgi:chorismate mutase / prephenate dehydratase